jgi:hypothetical protein
MPGDIQLTSAAIDTSPEEYRPVHGTVVGEQHDRSYRKLVPDELRDTSLPRADVENFMYELITQPAWRREADKCADYYDGNQLTEDLREKLQERGQPPLIDNLIKPTVDTVLGMEARTRTDWRVRPEDDEQCEDNLAEALSIKLKIAEQESRADRAISDAYAALVKAGLGWVEVARESDPFKCPYRVRYIHRRELFWDWRSEQPDLSDARYLIRRRWLDLDHAVAMMPQYANLFRMTCNAWSGFDPLLDGQDTGLVRAFDTERDTRMASADWRDVVRQKICMNEIWYRKWVRGYVMELPNGTVKEVDFNNPKHNEAIIAGVVKVRQATFQKVRLAWYAGPHFLYDVPSPYRHNQFPYVPFFGYREDLTGAPYGLIRSMISPQDEINARKSKMLWHLNSRRVITDQDAVPNHNVAMQEVARPDAYIILNKDRKPSSQFKVEPGGELASQQFQVLVESKATISEASGVHKTAMGQQTGASSGIAINTLADQGTNTLAELNDNHQFARRLVGEMLFDLVVQDLVKRGETRVTTGEGKRKRTIVLNQPAFDDQGRPTILNNVAKVRAKVVLDDIPSTPTARLQQLQQLTELTKALPPQTQAIVMDFVIEAMDLPNRHQIADRLRAANGFPDPDQFDQQLEEQRQQERALQAKQQKQVQQTQVLDAAEKTARTRKMHAEADRIQRDLQQSAIQPTAPTSSTPNLPLKFTPPTQQ